jgi:hypothetical protein
MNIIKTMNFLKNEKISNNENKNQRILREEIYEKNKLIKWIYNIIILTGGCGFLIVGISSYIQYNIIHFLNSDQIVFFPQGITMSFYGICAIIISINQIRITLNKIGEGYNEFNKDIGLMKIYRKGEKTDINITYPLTDIVCEWYKSNKNNQI